MLVVTIRCTNKMIEAPLSYSKSYPALVDREHREQDRSVWKLLSFSVNRRNDYSNLNLFQYSNYIYKNRIGNRVKDFLCCKVLKCYFQSSQNDRTERGD